MRVLVAHDLQTGLAMRPQWGPMYGPDAVSEQQLLESAIERLPPCAALIEIAILESFRWLGQASKRHIRWCCG